MSKKKTTVKAGSIPKKMKGKKPTLILSDDITIDKVDQSIKDINETPILTEAIKQMEKLAKLPTDVQVNPPPKHKHRRGTGLRKRKALNPHQQKILELTNEVKSLDKKRREYFEANIILKARNQQLLEQREQLVAVNKVLEDKEWMYSHMIKLNLDMHTFFSADPTILAKHSDIVAIKEKLVK